MSPQIGDQEYEDAKRLARSDDVNARRKLALRADMRPEILYFLAEDKDAQVRRAIAGNQVERGRNTTSHYEVTVRFDDNTTQRLTLNEAPAWRPGDRVRVVGGALRPL